MLYLDWREAVKVIHASMEQHLDELRVSLVSLAMSMVGVGPSTTSGKDHHHIGESSPDDDGLSTLLRNAFVKCFFGGDVEGPLPWLRALRFALAALFVVTCCVHLIMDLGVVDNDDDPAAAKAPTAKEDDCGGGSDDKKKKEEEEECYESSPGLAPATPTTSETMPDERAGDHGRSDDDDPDVDDDDDDDDDASSVSDRSPLVTMTPTRLDFDSAATADPSASPGTASVVDRMHEWSRGWTAMVPPTTLKTWWHRATLSQDGEEDGARVLKVLCGALWFRYHVLGQTTEELIKDTHELLGLPIADDNGPILERSGGVTGLDVVKWALRAPSNPRQDFLDGAVETLFHALSFLGESCRDRGDQCLRVPARAVEQLAIEILQSDFTFVQRYHDCRAASATTIATSRQSATIQSVLQATARRLCSYFVHLNVIQVQCDGQYRIDYRPTSPSLLTTTQRAAPFSVGELECSLNLVRWCIASDVVRYDLNAAVGLLHQPRLARGRMDRLGLPGAVRSWFRDVRNVELVAHGDVRHPQEQSLVPWRPTAWKSPCVRVMAACAMERLQLDDDRGMNSEGSDGDSMDARAAAMYRLGMCLSRYDADSDLAEACLEWSRQVWSPVLHRSVSETIPQQIEQVTAFLSPLEGDGDSDSTFRRLKVGFQQAQEVLRTGGNGCTPYWKVVRALIVLESMAPNARPAQRYGSDWHDLERAHERLRTLLETTGRISRCMASLLPVLAHPRHPGLDRDARRGRAAELASLGNAIERYLHA